jgi:CubicO group peptidase (beta-lactamase class C family)
MHPSKSWVWLLLPCLVGTLESCTPSSAPRARVRSSSQDGDEAKARPPVERKQDPRVSVDNLQARLTPYIESIGAGFGLGYRASGFVSVSAGGDNIYEHGFGQADRSAGKPNSEDTSFRVGAITKQFTAAAVLRLVGEGRLALTDTIGKHVPEYPEPGKGITLHQLLSHTSGLPSYMNHPTIVARRSEVFTPVALLELFWNEPLEFTPGSDFRYSDSDYAVLGVIIERVSGQSYKEHMEKQLFEAFDLDQTVVGDAPEDGDRAIGYSASDTDGLAPAEGPHPSILYAAGAIRSSASDLLRWHDALQEGEVLEPAQAEVWVRPVQNQFAYGWFVREEHGLTVLSHGGGVEGFVSHFARVPELDLAIVVLSNNSSVDATPIANAALAAALGENVEPPEKGTKYNLDPSVPPRITGTYRLSDAAAEKLKERKIPKKALQAMRSVRIYEENEKLFFKPAGQSAVPMIATGPNRFVLLGGQAKIEVELDSGGSPATRLVLDQGPLSVEFTRRARVRGKLEEPETTDEEP